MPLRSLRDHLFRQRHVEVLVIKQIDGELVHVCGVGILEDTGSVSHKRRELLHNNPAFPVRMHEGNRLLHPQDFNRLVLLEDVLMYPQGCRPREAVSMEVDGHRYRIAHTPMRCWHFNGHLVLERTPQGLLLSTEDMTMIRAKAQRQPNVSHVTMRSGIRADRAPSSFAGNHGETRWGVHGSHSGSENRLDESLGRARDLELEPKY